MGYLMRREIYRHFGLQVSRLGYGSLSVGSLEFPERRACLLSAGQASTNRGSPFGVSLKASIPSGWPGSPKMAVHAIDITCRMHCKHKVSRPAEI